MKAIFLFILGSFALALSGQDKMEFKTSTNSYIVGNGDVLDIRVYDESKLSGQYTVKENGSITFPLIGELEIGGMDVVSIQHLLTQKLSKDYLFNPIVNVSIFKYQSQSVYLLGNISKPGAYHLTKPTYLLDLLSDAKGLSQNLGLIRSGQKVDINRKLIRFDGEETYHDTTFSIDLYQLLIKGKSEFNIQLKNGDIIYISGQQMVHVVGQVRKPGSFPFEDNMNVLKAITLAGGINDKGSASKFFIKRVVDDKVVRIKAKLEDKVMADDIIEVPLGIW